MSREVHTCDVIRRNIISGETERALPRPSPPGGLLGHHLGMRNLDESYFREMLKEIWLHFELHAFGVFSN